MNFFTKAVALASMVGALALGGAANATTYILNTTAVGGFGAGPYGQVDVTGGGSSLDITLTLFNGTSVDTGSHFALTFNLVGTVSTASFIYQGNPLTGVLAFDAYPGSYANPAAPFTTNAAVSCPGCQGGALTQGTPWTLHLTGTGLGIGSPANFAADQLSQGATGVVWTGGGGIVPEPAEWALLIAGFAMVGFMLRRRHEGLAFSQA